MKARIFQKILQAQDARIVVACQDTNGIVEAFREMGSLTADRPKMAKASGTFPVAPGMNFSQNADPEPDLLLAILRQISLIENKQESRRLDMATLLGYH